MNIKKILIFAAMLVIGAMIDKFSLEKFFMADESPIEKKKDARCKEMIIDEPFRIKRYAQKVSKYHK
jgi:hypothetical protein